MRTTTPSDAVLVRRSLRHPEEFEVLFERHAATVLRYLQLRVGHSLAEELYAELTPDEIAEALGISTGSVRKRLHRARRFMAERLGLNGNEGDETLRTATTVGALTKQ